MVVQEKGQVNEQVEGNCILKDKGLALEQILDILILDEKLPSKDPRRRQRCRRPRRLRNKAAIYDDCDDCSLYGMVRP